jgi:hypothetical protein
VGIGRGVFDWGLDPEAETPGRQVVRHIGKSLAGPGTEAGNRRWTAFSTQSAITPTTRRRSNDTSSRARSRTASYTHPRVRMPDRLPPLRGDEDVSVALAARLRARRGRTLQFGVMRSSCLEAATRDFLRTAQAMGLAERVVAWRHGLRNALPLVASIVRLHPRLRRGT